MKRITSLFILFAFLFSPLSPVFAELTRDQQVELLRAEITRVTNELNAVLEERVYEGYSLILKDEGNSLQKLQIGDRGLQVSALQDFLSRKAGYTGATTGYYGPLTDASVKDFERQYSFYLNSHTLSATDKVVDGVFYNFSFVPQSSSLTKTVSSDVQDDIDFTRDVIKNTYNGVDRYKQDIVMTMNAANGSESVRAELGLESVVDVEDQEVYVYIGGDIEYDFGFFASGEGDIEAEMLMSREGVFVKVQDSDLYEVPAEYKQYFGEWIGLQFDDLNELMTAAEAQEFDELLEEAFEQLFNPDSQIEAYDMFPFYAINTSTKRDNNSLTRQVGEDVHTYDIRFDLDNFHELADALNAANPDVATFRASDIALVADEFGDVLDSLEITTDVTESKEMLGLDMSFSETETTSFGTSQIALSFKVVNRPGEGTVPNTPRNYIDVIELIEEIEGEALQSQSAARDARAVASLQQLQTAFLLSQGNDGLYPELKDITYINPNLYLNGDYEVKENGGTEYCVSYQLEQSRSAGQTHYQIDQKGARYTDEHCSDLEVKSKNDAPQMRLVSRSDHVQGDSNADVYVIAYSDMQCPFCKRYHDETLPELMDEYKDEEVGFVYRHFPLDAPFTSKLHPNATEYAVASECVAESTGDDGFYDFVGNVFEEQGALYSLRGDALETTLSIFAEDAGMNENDFDNCYENFDLSEVSTDFQEGIEAGVQGVPTIFIQDKDGNMIRAAGNFSLIKSVVDELI